VKKSDLIFIYLMAGMGGFNAVSSFGWTALPMLAIAGGIVGLWALRAKNNLSDHSDS
jgi:hypothetical protein